MHLTAEASCFDFSALCRTFMATIKIPSSDDHCFISKLWSHLRSEEAGVPLDLNDPEMAPQLGDETVVVGRWDFDCGHESATKSGEVKTTGFRSEMHAPAILISAHITKNEPSSLQTRYKIFAGSRSGPLDTVPLLFFFQRLWGTHINQLGGQDYSIALQAPQDGWRIASCTSEEGTPPGGRSKKIETQLQPSDGGKSLTLTLLSKPFNSGARVGRSMIVNAVWVPENSPGRQGAVKCE